MSRKNWVSAVALGAALLASVYPVQPGSADDRYLTFEYDWKMNFGVLIVKDPFGLPVQKQLTFDPLGQTNGILVRIDGKDAEYGTEAGQFLERGKESENPSRCVWTVGKVAIKQVLEIMPGKTGKLDTLVVRYDLENKDDRPHTVGIRVMIDSAIGTPENDGVPFRYSGGSDLVTTFKDFPQGAVPEWVEALEKNDQTDPGTITVMTLKMGGGLEPPIRASITRWPGYAPAVWEIPLESFNPEGAKKDSSLVLYWEPAEIAPGQKRSLGYGYGTQDKPSDDVQPSGTSGSFREPTAAQKPPRSKSLSLPGGSDSTSSGNDGSGEAPPSDPIVKPERQDTDNDSPEQIFEQGKLVLKEQSCCQGELSAQHAQCALKAALGIIPRESQIDADGDGEVTKADALLLLQLSVASARSLE